MLTVIESPTQVDRCDNCHGLYFDQLTQGLLDGLLGQEVVDTGSEEMGAEYNELVFVDCPKCDTMMDQRLIEEPVRIRFELCPTCNATFLDAGEFREYTSSDYLKDFRSLLPPG